MKYRELQKFNKARLEMLSPAHRAIFNQQFPHTSNSGGGNVVRLDKYLESFLEQLNEQMTEPNVPSPPPTSKTRPIKQSLWPDVAKILAVITTLVIFILVTLSIQNPLSLIVLGGLSYVNSHVQMFVSDFVHWFEAGISVGMTTPYCY